MSFLDTLMGDVQEAPDAAHKLFSFLIHGSQGQGGPLLNGPAPSSVTGAPKTGTFPTATPPFVAKQPQMPVQTGTFPTPGAPTPPAIPAAAAPAPAPAIPAPAPAAAPPRAAPPASMSPVELGPGAAPAVPNAPLQAVDLGPTPQPSAPARPGPVDLTSGQKWKTAGLGVLSGVDAARKYYDEQHNAPAYAYDEEVDRGRKTVANEQTVGKNSAEIERDLAQADNQRSEADARRNPQPKTDPNEGKTVDTGEGVYQYNTATKRYDIRINDSKTKGAEEKFMGVPLKDIQAEIQNNPKTYPNGDIYSNRKKAAGALMTAEAAAKRDPNEGTWQIVEDQDGKPVEFNTKTRQVKSVDNVQRSGTAAKQTAADAKAREPFQSVLDKEGEAKEFAAEKTGPGDVGLILAMVEATRPKAGFRMTQTEWNMIQHARSTVGDVQALMSRVDSGQLLTPVQRKQMLDVIAIASHAAQDRLNKMGGAGGAAGADKSYSDAEVQAAVAAHPGTTAAQIEQAYKSKGYIKK